MRLKSNRTWFGIGSGLLAPWLIVFVFYLIKFQHLSFINFIEISYLTNIFVQLISLCVLANLGLFYVFIWTNNDYAAKGVLISTFIYAGLVVIMKVTESGYNMHY